MSCYDNFGDKGSTNSSSLFPPVSKGIGAETFESSPMRVKETDVDRGKMSTETYKRKDGSYVTEEAREIGEMWDKDLDKVASDIESCAHQSPIVPTID
uniref:Uncharacterized protein n=1 Tax=Solanum lycopersicum TaxID=4081 RepID=A0A3Q7HBE8_SOLLC